MRPTRLDFIGLLTGGKYAQQFITRGEPAVAESRRWEDPEKPFRQVYDNVRNYNYLI